MRSFTVVSIFALCVAAAWTHPSPRDASSCDPSSCLIENNCRCASVTSPAPKDQKSPQLVAITVSESIVQNPVYEDYIVPLFYDRVNPDQLPIGMTFFVNHEYTDYRLVQDLWLHGHEIGVHSVTKTLSQKYWRNASLETLVEEFQGQREIISKFANIPIEEIVGARTPQLQINGDISIEAYDKSGITYDNSWPTLSTRRLFPYTLDYASSQECTATMTCPKNSQPGFWIAPITDIKGGDGKTECNSLATCEMRGDSDKIADWLYKEVDRVRNDNRAPLILRLDSYWFSDTENSFKGFTQFLDKIQEEEDIFLVSVGQVLEWTKNPVALADFTTDDHSDRLADCYPVLCSFQFNGEPRNMGSCVSCPDHYPWKGDPSGNGDKIFADEALDE